MTSFQFYLTCFESKQILTFLFQCSAVSLISPTSQSACSLVVPQPQHFQQLLSQLHQQENNSMASSQIMESSHASLPLLGPVVTSTCEILSHRFLSPSRNCDLKNNGTTCSRHPHSVNALVYASHCFEGADVEDTFELRIDQVHIFSDQSVFRSQKISGSFFCYLDTYLSLL